VLRVSQETHIGLHRQLVLSESDFAAFALAVQTFKPNLVACDVRDLAVAIGGYCVDFTSFDAADFLQRCGP
jgi:hypothetical protein